MKYYERISQCATVQAVLRAIARGRSSHAYLICSEDEYTNHVVTAAIISQMIGGDPQRAYDGAYADIRFFPTEDRDKILVRDIDDVTSTASVTPTELPYKFYVIKKAETMNDSAQNKLLKTLEEAPSKTVIILESVGAKSLLPTVLSRCNKVEVPPFDYREIEEAMLSQYGGDERIYPAVGLSGGYFGKAESVMGQKSYYESFRFALETLVFMKTSRNILSYSAKWMAKKDSLIEIIDCLAVIFGDCLNYSAGRISEVRLKSFTKEINELSKLYDYRVCAFELPVLTEAKRKLSFNCNAQAVIDGLLFSILEVKAKCQKS